MKIIVDELPKSAEECPFATEEIDGYARCKLRKYDGVCTLEWPNPECDILKVAESTPVINLDGASMGENISKLTEQLEEMIKRNRERGV